jgi:hypothetical protein
MREFDTTISLGDHHLAAAAFAGRRSEEVVAVRTTVQRMDGPGWIDVEAFAYPSRCEGWVIVYPRGRCITPDTPHYAICGTGLKKSQGQPWLPWVHRSSPSQTAFSGHRQRVWNPTYRRHHIAKRALDL